MSFCAPNTALSTTQVDRVEWQSADSGTNVPNRTPSVHKLSQAEPRWAAALAFLAIGGLFIALPEPLFPGPNWLLLFILAVLETPTMLSHRFGRLRLNRILGLVISCLVTAALIWSLGSLIHALPSHREPPVTLLRSAAALWISNVLVFATWYWRLDAGGPNQRDTRNSHEQGAFLFPQMLLPPGSKGLQGPWKPGFIDYLFLAFNTSTAFSPTDVPVLSRWAKSLMMIQSLISLGTIAILAARAVNIL